MTSASRYIMSASHYRPRYQSRSSMYIRGLIPRNFAELTESVPIAIVTASVGFETEVKEMIKKTLGIFATKGYERRLILLDED